MPDNATPTPSSAEHDAAMVAKFEGNSAPQTQAPSPAEPAAPAANPERPAWLPEKFNSAEDLAKAYSELEAKQSAAPEANPAAATPGDAAQVAASAGLDYDALSAEYAAGGALSDDSYAKLEAAGIPRSMVDSYITGQEAVAAQFEGSVKAAVGGDETFSKIVTWAGTNLPAEDVKAFNATIDAAAATGDIASAKLALVGLKARYEEANGSAPRLLGGGAGDSHGDVFRSVAELTQAMSDPRYARDPAYRKDVEAKVSRSSILK